MHRNREIGRRRTLTGTLSIAAALILSQPLATAAAGAPRALVLEAEGVHVVGPPLTSLHTKIADPNWLAAFLLRPSRLRRPPLMGDFRLSVDEAQAIATYLYAGKPPIQSKLRWRGGDAQIGASLFVSRGCRGCHAIKAGESSISARVPNLAGTGIKVRGDWLFNWIKSPRAYDPGTAMPQLVLSDDEIRHLVAFLLSCREGSEVVAAAPRFRSRPSPETALAAIRRFDCPKCHLIPGFQTVAPSAELSFMPHSCRTCHEPARAAPPRPHRAAPTPGWVTTALEDGRMLVAQYNCRGCHRIEGSGGAIAEHLERKSFAPPTLDGEGARVQTTWLIDYLQRPKPLRTWLHMRMPDFALTEAEAAALARYFAALAHIEAADDAREPAREDIVERGRRRFLHFKCLQCHPASGDAQLPQGVDAEDLSINLALVKTRLRPAWVRAFLARPKTVVGTETRMPSVFYTSDGIPSVEHPDADIEAITSFLFEMTELPQPRAEDAAPELPREVIDWGVHPY